MRHELSAIQQRVFDVLDLNINTDVPITMLYGVAYGNAANTDSVRDMQQKLGPLFARINKKLKRGRIEPGELKRTYRLNTKWRAKDGKATSSP